MTLSGFGAEHHTKRGEDLHMNEKKRKEKKNENESPIKAPAWGARKWYI